MKKNSIKIVDKMFDDDFKPTLKEIKAVFEGKTDSNGCEFWWCYKCGGKTTKPHNQCDDVYCLKCGREYPTYVTAMYMAGIIIEELCKTVSVKQ